MLWTSATAEALTFSQPLSRMMDSRRQPAAGQQRMNPGVGQRSALLKVDVLERST